MCPRVAQVDASGKSDTESGRATRRFRILEEKLAIVREASQPKLAAKRVRYIKLGEGARQCLQDDTARIGYWSNEPLIFDLLSRSAVRHEF